MELAERKIKHSPESIVAITKLDDEQIIFLETGSSQTGLTHILARHREDFNNRRVSQEQIVNLIFLAIKASKLLGIQGSSRKIYEIDWEGTTQYISIDIGSNGYIVSANPTPKKVIKRLLEIQEG